VINYGDSNARKDERYSHISRLVCGGIVMSFLLGFFGITFETSIYYLISGGFFSFAVLHFILAFFVRCPNCGKCLTIQGLQAVHPASIHKSWSSVVFHWFSGRVGCIHCGSTVSTNDL
jgi:hypothetical protein